MNYEQFIADSVRDVPPSGIRKFFDIASEMKNVISMSVGEPDFITPWNIRASAIASVERGMTHYTSNSGLLELRKLISCYLKSRFRTGKTQRFDNKQSEHVSDLRLPFNRCVFRVLLPY